MLKITNLHAKADDTEILHGINLEIKAGEVHAIMGTNGSGKSTLSKVIAGHPDYEMTEGQIEYQINGTYQDISELEVYNRAREGIFLGFQYPVEIPGITNLNFLMESFNAVCRHQGADEMDEKEFLDFLRPKLEMLEMNEAFLNRAINEGFSGGEKKKNEILQMSVLSPRLSFLDETDSGLDIDALKIVSHGVNQLKSKFNATVLITHYQRLLDYIKPDFVHILHKGKIIMTGDFELAKKLENDGYDWLIKDQK